MRPITRTIVLSLPFAFVGQAVAGDYHIGTQLICSDCHIMHFSQSHGGDSPYTQDQGNFTNIIPQPALLRAPINELCLSCHDGANSTLGPDVMDVDTGLYAATVDSRSAGYLNSLAFGDPETGHTLDSADSPPGYGGVWSGTLDCADCHEQHGIASQYRNLHTDVGNITGAAVTYASTTNVLTQDVYARKVGGDGGGTGNGYDESQVDWNEPNTSASAIAGWCKGCHTNFHGAVAGAEVGGSLATGGFIRHPAAEVNVGAIGAPHSTDDTYTDAGTGARVKVMDSLGVWGIASVNITPTCITCHKAHGNGNKFGLIYRKASDNASDITEDGSTNGIQYENLCQQCHAQADPFG